MKKKRARSKLQLNRETLRSLDQGMLSRAAGGTQCGSENCTNVCTGANCTGGNSQCVCPLTDDSTGCNSVIFCTGFPCLE